MVGTTSYCVLVRRAQEFSSQERIAEIVRLWVELDIQEKTRLNNRVLEKQAQMLSMDERKYEIARLWKLQTGDDVEKN